MMKITFYLFILVGLSDVIVMKISENVLFSMKANVNTSCLIHEVGIMVLFVLVSSF